ncbi:MAG: hypothetical protein LBF79_04075 [Dysgonamonadaceae bacterium]|jgi:hypothetical protein|nr:hypothetical protein [Dysgonamonadaceae bacterium]
MKKRILLPLAGICLLHTYAKATDRDSTGIHNEILLEREYNPTILDAIKIDRIPDSHEPPPPVSKVKFSDYDTMFGFTPDPSYMKQQSQLIEPNISKYRGYLSGEVNNLLDANADAGYMAINNPKNYLSFGLSHNSSRSKRTFSQGKDLSQKFKFSDSSIKTNYIHRFGNAQLTANAKYLSSIYNLSQLRKNVLDRNTVYMVNNDYSESPKNNLVEANAGLSSTEQNNFNYSLNLKYSFFGQEKSSNSIPIINENLTILDWNLNKTVNSSSASLGLAGSIRNLYYHRSNTFAAENHNLRKFSVVSLNPYYRIEGNNFDLKLGLVLSLKSGPYREKILAPAIKFNWSIHEKAHLYAISDGGHEDNSKYNMFYENRYANPVHRTKDSRSPLNTALGLRFLPLQELKIDLFAGYKITKNEHYFIQYNYGRDIYRYYSETVYNDESTSHLGGEIKYVFADNFEFGAKAVYYKRKLKYTDGNISIPSQKPRTETSATIGYNPPNSPLRFDLSYYGAYGRRTIECLDMSNNVPSPDNDNLSFEYVKMKNIHDTSLKTTYTFKPNFSAYLTVNNLLFQQYDFWYGYPVQPFNVMAGISFLF